MITTVWALCARRDTDHTEESVKHMGTDLPNVESYGFGCLNCELINANPLLCFFSLIYFTCKFTYTLLYAIFKD